MAGEFDFLSSPNFGALGGIAESANIAKTRAGTQLDVAQAGHAAAETEKLQLENAEQKNFISALQNIGGGAAPNGGPSPSSSGQPAALSSRLATMSRIALDAGAPTKGLEYAKGAATVLGAETNEGLRKIEGTKAQLQAHQMVLDRLGGMSQQVLDAPPALQQRLYEQGLAEMAKDPTLAGEVGQMPALYADAVPRLRMFVGESEKAKDQISQVTRLLTLQNTENNQAARLVISEALLGIRERLANITADREARLEKNGGKATSAPNGNDMKLANQMLGEQFPALAKMLNKDYKPKDDVEAAALSHAEAGARDTAGQAKELARKNSIPYQTALAQVISKQQAAGDWNLTTGVWHALSANTPAGVNYRGGGTTAETAVVAPPPTDRVQGHFYIYKGQVGQWDGKGLVPVGSK